MSEQDSTRRLDALEARVGQLEDERAIGRLLARYGFTADLGLVEEWVDLWVPEGVYSLGEGNVSTYQGRFEGHDRLRALISGDGMPPTLRSQHHTTGPVTISVEGDHATADGYSVTYVQRDHGVAVWNLGYNRWSFRRTPDGWRIVRRDRREAGSAEIPEVLGGTSPGPQPQGRRATDTT